MKQFNRYLIFSLLSVCIFSCSKENTTIDAIPTSMKISFNKTTVVADGIDEVTVTVKDQDGNDISLSSLIYVDDVPIRGNLVFFENNQQGSHTIYANKYGIFSDTLSIATTAPAAAKYSTKVLAEYFTGSWCGWCPRVDYKLNAFMAANTDLLAIQIHNNDIMADRNVDSTLRATYGISSVPNILINRKAFLQENGDVMNQSDSTLLAPHYQKRAVIGLALNTSITGNTLNVTAKTGFDATIHDSLRLVVLLVEDNVIAPQTNYYDNNDDYAGNPFYNSGNPITNFVHNGVYRLSPTTISGITIPADKQVKDDEYSANFSLDITGLNAANLKVVAFVMFADSQTRTGIMNAQWVAAGQNKNYD
ncbi:MAG: Omp28-related outer membrane protein [Chitinophagaceae bacterium]|nr:Omp28-related outer membrane protein [Chitinophagaceae bacterium]MCW5905221.1 Omp28-related outer membrane protein [Chitinophagaceae bacterium]